MPAPRRFIALPLLLAVCVWAVAGCGGGHKPAHGFRTPLGLSAHAPGWGQAPKHLTLPRPLLGVPSGEMFDTISLSTVPNHPFALAGYTAGFWPTFGPLRRSYPQAHTVSIAIASGFHADCLDVEPGDAPPSQAGGWARADIRAGFARPCLYSNLSEMPAVRASLAAAGLRRSQYFLWLAWYRFIPGLVAGYDAVQWTDRALGRNLDESTVSLAFLSIAHPPYRAPKPQPPKPKPPAPTPHPGSSYNENFTGGFQRGFIVHWDRRHHRPIPAPEFRATNRLAYNTGFQSGWRSVR